MRVVVRLFILIFVFSIASVTSKAEEPCSTVLKKIFPITVARGKEVNSAEVRSLLNLEAAENAEVFSGGSIGKVYRVSSRSPNTSPYILKVMPNPEAINDELAFSLFREAAGTNTEVQIVSSQIVKRFNSETQMTKDMTLVKLSDVQGTTLFNLLADENVPSKLKKKLIKRYSKFGDQVQIFLKEKYGVRADWMYPERSYFPVMNDVLDRFEREKMMKLQPKIFDIQIKNPRLGTFHLTLKSDNIIVDQQYKLHLIDPR